MNRRSSVPRSTEMDVLVACRRRCCLCLFLNHRDEVRKGQIAHLNGDRNDHSLENLMWLCLEHHDEFDSRTSQSKGLTISEVRHYRDLLYAKYGSTPVKPETPEVPDVSDLEEFPETSEYEVVLKRFPDDLGFIVKPWRYHLWQVANQPDLFAYKAGNRADGVCLIERIDLPDGRVVIACIAVPGNPGNSITNAVEEICFQVCKRFEIPPDKIVWLEHYDYEDGLEWQMVTFEKKPPDAPFSNPRWVTMTKALWTDLRLRPKAKLTIERSHFNSKLTKLFHWPMEAIL